MSDDRRFVTLELPGETVVLDVPAVAPVKRFKPVEAAPGYPVNMTYATAEDLRLFRPESEPEKVD